MTAPDISRTIDAVWRIEAAKIIGGLTRIVRDVGVAEELAQDALVTALEQWPAGGIPDNPGAWLMTAAKHPATDLVRRQALHARKQDEITYEIEAQLQEAAPPEPGAALDDPVGDDVLRLAFIPQTPNPKPQTPNPKPQTP